MEISKMKNITPQDKLLEKWSDFIDPKKYKDIKSRYDAIQIAYLLENTFTQNKAELMKQVNSEKLLLEDGENGVPINGMQPSLLLPVMRRMYPKIIMKEFVSTQTLATPNAVIHYLRKIYKSSKNGITAGIEFTGLPSIFDQYGGFNPFFSSELIAPATITQGSIEHEKEITLAPGSVTFTDEKRNTSTVSIEPTDETNVRRIVLAVTFKTADDDFYCGWLIRGRNAAGYAGGIEWKYTFLPAYKKLVTATSLAIPSSSDFSYSVSTGSITVAYGGTAYAQMIPGWLDKDTGNSITGTTVGYYSLDSRKFPKIMPEMGIQIDTMPITLNERSFRIRYSPKEEKIFQDYLNLNLSSELVNVISDEMAYEIDREIKMFIEQIIIEDLREYVDVSEICRFSFTGYGANVTATLPNGSFYDPMAYLYLRIELMAAKMERMNKMGRPNKLLVSPAISAFLNTLSTYKLFSDEVSHPAGGIYKSGTIANKYDVYVDPQAQDDTIILAYNYEASPFGAGIVFAPYFSYLSPEIYDGDTADKTRLLIMDYGLEKVPFGEFLYGALHVSGIPGISGISGIPSGGGTGGSAGG